MCLNTNIGTIAKKSITCYKRFVKTGLRLTPYKTPIRDFKWPKGNKLVTVPSFGVVVYANTDGGTHAQVNQGLHAYKKLETAQLHRSFGEVVKAMTIPKGTRIISNKREIVALAMKMGAPKKEKVNVKPKSKRAK